MLAFYGLLLEDCKNQNSQQVVISKLWTVFKNAGDSTNLTSERRFARVYTNNIR